MNPSLSTQGRKGGTNLFMIDAESVSRPFGPSVLLLRLRAQSHAPSTSILIANADAVWKWNAAVLTIIVQAHDEPTASAENQPVRGPDRVL